MIENLNSQVQRAMQAVIRISNDPAVICHLIAQQINNQKRKNKGNNSPIQLLRMKIQDVNRVNREFPLNNSRTMKKLNLPEIKVGDKVRKLMMSRKEQTNPGINPDMKGFSVKWSQRIYMVIRKQRMQKNFEVYKYWISPKTEFTNKAFYRHELLLLKGKVDSDIPKVPDKMMRRLQKNRKLW